MEIKRSGSRPSGKGPADYFTGAVRIDPLFEAPEPGPCSRCERHLRAGRPDGMAYPSARSDIDCHRRLRLGAARRRRGRGNPAWRCGLVPAWREALARRDPDDGNDAYRHSGSAERQSRRMDGKGQRPAIPGLTTLTIEFARTRTMPTARRSDAVLGAGRVRARRWPARNRICPRGRPRQFAEFWPNWLTSTSLGPQCEPALTSCATLLAFLAASAFSPDWFALLRCRKAQPFPPGIRP